MTGDTKSLRPHPWRQHTESNLSSSALLLPTPSPEGSATATLNLITWLTNILRKVLCFCFRCWPIQHSLERSQMTSWYALVPIIFVFPICWCPSIFKFCIRRKLGVLRTSVLVHLAAALEALTAVHTPMIRDVSNRMIYKIATILYARSDWREYHVLDRVYFNILYQLRDIKNADMCIA